MNTNSNFPAPTGAPIATADTFRSLWKTEQNVGMRGRAMPLLQECRDGRAALAFAGIDWGVQTSTLGEVAPDLAHAKNAHRHVVAIRDSDGAVVGVNGQRHQVIQNEALALLGDAIIAQRPEFRYVSGGSTLTGETTFLVLESEERIVYGPNDEGARSILLVNDFGGNYPLFARAADYRFSCSNQFSLSTRKKRLVTVRHTSSANWQVSAARQTIAAAVKEYDEIDKELHRLLNTSVTLHDVKEELIGARPVVKADSTERDIQLAERRQRAYDAQWDKLVSEYIADWNAEHIGTAFGVVMAAQGVDEHASRCKRGQRDIARVQRAIKGEWPLMRRALAAV